MDTTIANKRLLTLRQVSQILSLSINTLRNLIAAGKLAAVRSGPRSKILVDVRELESFCERNACMPDARVEEVTK